MYIRIISLIISALLVLSLLAGCSKPEDGDEETTGADVVETTGADGDTTDADTTRPRPEPFDTDGDADTTLPDAPVKPDTTDGTVESPVEDTEGKGKDTSANTNSNGEETKTVSGNGQTADKGTDTTNKADTPVNIPKPADVSYEKYHAMKAEDQQAFFDSFDSIEGFFDWYKAAKAKYEKDNPDQEIGDGPIDLGDLVG